MKRNLLSILFIAVTLGLIVIVAFSNSELTDAWSALFTLDFKWIFLALFGWFAYFFFDMLALYYFLHMQKNPISLGGACYVSLIGFYYSNITPGASGGQPMQVYSLSKCGVPVPIGTSAISIKFFAQQLMLVLMAALFWLADAGFVNQQLGGVRWAVYLGVGLNAAAIPLILLVALHRPLVQAIITFLIRLGAKMRLVKHPEDMIVRVSAGLDVYHASILRLTNHPGQIVGMLLLAGMSILGLMSVPLSVYHAFRMSGTPWYHLITVAFLLFLSASYTPLPGASGAQEGGFLVFFQGMFTQGTIGLALLVWRFFTYYLFLLVGAVMSIGGNIRMNRRHARETAAAGGAPAPEVPAPEAPAPEARPAGEEN
jgi:glycosyltransferase 2 family protein